MVAVRTTTLAAARLARVGVLASLALSTATLLTAATGGSPAVVEPVQVPAASSRLAAKGPIIAAAVAGARVVGVGARGHVVYSDDMGLSWTQARVPVSVDLVSVQFPLPRMGWATGHDGVVLKTIDAGASWTVALDGRQAAQLMLDYYAAQSSGDSDVKAALAEVRLFVQERGARPFLDVFFQDADNGFVVGAWGLILRTKDGGATWTPWMHRVENPQNGHFYAIRSVASQLWIAGDQGLLLKWDPVGERFASSRPPQGGSLFGLLGGPGYVLAHGLFGRAVVSRDGGRTWDRSVGLGSSSLTGGAVLADGRIVLVDGSAGAWVSRDDGRNFTTLDVGASRPYTGVVDAGDKTLVLVGLGGVRPFTMAAP